jgi:transglutaminase-like putative cysteine protease
MIRPLAAGLITGLARVDADLLVVDTRSGRVAVVDPQTDDTVVVNEGYAQQFVGARGLAISGGRMWSTTSAGIMCWPLATDGRRVAGPAELFASCQDAQGIAVVGGVVYTVHDRSGDRTARVEARHLDGELDQVWPIHGIGRRAICATDDALWVVSDAEQTLYCLDRQTGEELFRAVTPQELPTAVLAQPEATPADPGELLVAYYSDEPFIADDPWSQPNWVLRYRDRALVAPMHLWHDAPNRRAYSTGYRVVMEYFVELDPDDERSFPDLTWRIGLPLETARQHVRSIAPVGLPFTVVESEGQPMAEFELGTVGPNSRGLVGWRAELDLFGIKHLIGPADCPRSELPPGFAAKYLVDDYDLAMAAPAVIDAAQRAAGGASDPVTVAHNIRNWVYDHVDYEMGNADDPEVVLARGTGSCGEYVGVLMALTRLSGMASRAAGRYKVPYFPWTRGEPLYPDFNHAWLDLYLPGVGWVPIESNPDDTDDGGPYPDRFFLGLPWRHIELTKDVSFETVTYSHEGRRRRGSAGRLSRNHIRFRILDELAPVPPGPDAAGWAAG